MLDAPILHSEQSGNVSVAAMHNATLNSHLKRVCGGDLWGGFSDVGGRAFQAGYQLSVRDDVSTLIVKFTACELTLSRFNSSKSDVSRVLVISGDFSFVEVNGIPGAMGCGVVVASRKANCIRLRFRAPTNKSATCSIIALRAEGVGSLVACAVEHAGLGRQRGASPRAADFDGMVSFIEANLHNPALGSELLAEHFKVSARKVYGLFKENGAQLKNVILSQRLAAARVRIDHGGEKVANIIADCGFSTPSTFYRNYRKRYGCLPRR